MSESESSRGDDNFVQTAHTALRLGVLFVVLYWCYQILAPFLPFIIWGGIIAVATHPLHESLSARLGGRTKLSATLITLLGLVILTVPMVVLTESLVHSSMDLAAKLSEGSLHVPPPPDRVEALPIVGEQLHSTWSLAAENLSAALQRFGPQLKAFSGTLIATAGGAAGAFLQLFFSMIIAGVFLAAKEGSAAAVRSVMGWLVVERSSELLLLFETTIRSVAKGVLGVAIIEATLSAIGLVIADVPAAGLWTLLILILSIAQLPPLLPLIPLAAYVIATADPVSAIVFVIISAAVVLVDTILKPLLLGRGTDAPMLVILMGAIGGMIVAGIVGLFIGAVVLVLGWEIAQYWITGATPAAEPPGQSE
jgi:predicted PurR-regulated permease PerM